MSTKENIEKEGSGEKKRGFLLTTWLLLIFLSGVYNFTNLISGIEGFQKAFSEAEFYMFFISSVLIILITTISTISLFMWKKWGFFGICLGYFLSIIMSLIINPSSGAFVPVIIVVGLYIFLEDKWEFLE